MRTSGAEHLLESGVHVLLLDQLAPIGVSLAFQHSTTESRVLFQQAQGSVPNQFAGVGLAVATRNLRQLGFLLLCKMDLHRTLLDFSLTESPASCHPRVFPARQRRILTPVSCILKLLNSSTSQLLLQNPVARTQNRSAHDPPGAIDCNSPYVPLCAMFTAFVIPAIGSKQMKLFCAPCGAYTTTAR
jgi:hypothetical protein